jgi:hypothetical protein
MQDLADDCGAASFYTHGTAHKRTRWYEHDH